MKAGAGDARLRGMGSEASTTSRRGEGSPADAYALLAEQARALLAGEPDALANAGNFVALLHHGLADVNWTGLYLLRDGELVLGPFQGRPACVRIGLGSGVCGTAAAEDRTLRVADVHRFEGHIACDPASRSEIVLPLHHGGRVAGVLDIDSPFPERFTAADEAGLAVLRDLFLELMGSGVARL